MTERSRAFLAELERAADLADGMLSRRFLSVFTLSDPRLDAIPEADLARIRAHFLAAVAEAGHPHRSVGDHTLLSQVEVRMFHAMFEDAGRRILADGELAPATTEVIRFLCPFCDAPETEP